MLAAGQPTKGRGSGRKDMEGSRHCRTSTTPSHPLLRLQKHAQVVTHHSYPAMSLEAFPTQHPQHSTWHHLQKNQTQDSQSPHPLILLLSNHMCYAPPDYHSPSGTNGCNHHSFQSARWQYSTPRYGLTHFSKQQNEGRHGCTQRITFEHALLHPITCQNKRTTFKTPKIRLKTTQNPPKKHPESIKITTIHQMHPKGPPTSTKTCI